MVLLSESSIVNSISLLTSCGQDISQHVSYPGDFLNITANEATPLMITTVCVSLTKTQDGLE